MPDRERVIKGLECCIEAKDKHCPIACPFFNECFLVFASSEPFYPIMRAALELLKEQQETISSLQGTIRKLNAALEEQSEIVWCADETIKSKRITENE